MKYVGHVFRGSELQNAIRVFCNLQITAKLESIVICIDFANQAGNIPSIAV